MQRRAVMMTLLGMAFLAQGAAAPASPCRVVRVAELTKSEAAELATLRARVEADEPRMVSYKFYESKFLAAQHALAKAERQARHTGKHVSDIHRGRVVNAREAWENNGFKVEVEETLERIHQLSAKAKSGG
jgi:hypothetical protein